jgi:hypothetical protein
VHKCIFEEDSLLRGMRNFLHISKGNHSGMIVNYVTVVCCVICVLCEPIIEYLVVDIRMFLWLIFTGENGGGGGLGNGLLYCLPTSFLYIKFMRACI